MNFLQSIKTTLRLLALVLAVPATAFSHAEIFFPKLLSYSDLPTTGIVLLNADPTIANVSIYLVSPEGSVVSSKTTQISAGRQMATLASELFPNATKGGWIYVFTDTEGMQGFWIAYDAQLTFLDGGQAAQYENTGPDQIIPLVAGDTELTILCLSGLRVPVPVTVRLFGSDGSELAPAFVQSLSSAAAIHASVPDLFPSANLAEARYIRIQTEGPSVASSAFVKHFLVPVEAAVVEGANAGTSTEMNFPHVVNGTTTEANYTTVLGVTNLSTSPQSVAITFNTTEGNSIVVMRDLAGNGALRESAQSLFGLSSEFQSGWVRVTGTAPITGFAAYADRVGRGVAAVPVTVSQPNLFFLHVADGPPQWQTGLVLLNTNDVPATVEMYAVDSLGSLIGKKTVTIDAGRRIAGVVHELIPQTRGMNGGFIFVRSLNRVPLYGLELFYTEDLRVLSNVAAGKLAAGVVYVPPSQ